MEHIIADLKNDNNFAFGELYKNLSVGTYFIRVVLNNELIGVEQFIKK